MRESLARACTEAETALALQGLGAHPVHAYGTDAQRAHWLPRVSDGTAVAAFALSEPGAGSDAAALALRAEPDGTGGWCLIGEKTWISNAPEADFYTVFARTAPDAGARGVTAFLVPADRPGLTGTPSTCCPRTPSAPSTSTRSRSPPTTCSANRTAASASP